MRRGTPTRARLTPGILACIAILSAGASPDCRAAQAGDASKPNIILILTDDVGLGNIGCCGGAFQTPNIDALAKTGTRFELCYSTPLCGPSRCQTLTGRSCERPTAPRAQMPIVSTRTTLRTWTSWWAD